MASSQECREIAGLKFRFVGTCTLDRKLKSGVRFSLSNLQDERVVYSFFVDDRVNYIGICDNSNTTLQSRMARYQGMMGAGTNKRIVGLIRRELRSGRGVRIAAWKPDEVVQYRSLPVDLVKGLENPLINALKPKWNIKG